MTAHEKWKQKIETEILELRRESEKLRLDTERRFRGTQMLLQQGAKILVRFEQKVDALIDNMTTPTNGRKKKS